ncbi:MAG: SUMF1/EgtB/PvdO family nonheme iron enzyme [Pseudomonadota bacterium]
MADIFLSYSRADRPIAQLIAEALEAEGFSVWWDKVLRAGQTYDEVTESMLRDSDVVIVLWSETSVRSKWVRAEATLGQRSSELVPAMIEEADRPIMFELTQTADLIGWAGDRNDPRWGDFVTDVKRSLDRHKAAAEAPVAAPVAEVATPSSSSQDDSTIETVFWTSIKDADDPADFEAYLKRYPDGHYSDLARNRLAALGASAAATSTPAAPPKLEPQPTATAAPPPSANPQPTKKKSSPLPLLLGGLIVVGAGGWFGLQALQSPSAPSQEEDLLPPISDLPVAACEGCPEMVAIPSGRFQMGSPDTEANRSGNEGPMREVTLNAFLISKSEVTWDAWQICVDEGGCRAAQGSGAGATPVSGVNYEDAVAYTEWLSTKSDRRYRLPSEAQWEYAARAGTDSPYWWGASYPGPGVVTGGPAAAGELTENPFGLVGMLGNVREWVVDCYVNSYADAPSNERPVGSSNCARPVVRGGSWRDGAAEHRAANRARFSRTVRDRSLGFRVVAQATAS